MLSQQRQADLLLVATTLIAAFGWICSREAVSGMPVMAFLGARFGIAGILLFLFCRKTELQQLIRHFRGVILSGILQASFMLLWIYGVATTRSLGEYEPLHVVCSRSRMADIEKSTGKSVLGITSRRHGRSGVADA